MTPLPEPVAVQDLLRQTAVLAGPPPSPANPQALYWAIHDGILELHADPGRVEGGGDPDGRLMTISCGVALHRAQIVFAGLGARGRVRPGGPGDLFASIERTGSHLTTASDIAMDRALRNGRTRPAVFDEAGTTALLAEAAHAFGISVWAFDGNTTRFLDATASTATTTQRRDSVYRQQLAAWTAARDLPAATSIDGEPQAVHLALIASGDSVRDWLHAGQALSAVLLTATAHGLTAAIEDLAEAPGTRAMLRTLNAPAGQPQILIRVTATLPTKDDRQPVGLLPSVAGRAGGSRQA